MIKQKGDEFHVYDGDTHVATYGTMGAASKHDQFLANMKKGKAGQAAHPGSFKASKSKFSRVKGMLGGNPSSTMKLAKGQGEP